MNEDRYYGWAYGGLCCRDCGALTGDPNAHDQWHEDVEDR